MGRRTRSRAQQQGAAKVVVKAQQLARVNVSKRVWQEFRVRALRGGTTVADYHGELVKKELQRRVPSAAVTPAPPVVADGPRAWED